MMFQDLPPKLAHMFKHLVPSVSQAVNPLENSDLVRAVYSKVSLSQRPFYELILHEKEWSSPRCNTARKGVKATKLGHVFQSVSVVLIRKKGQKDIRIVYFLT